MSIMTAIERFCTLDAENLATTAASGREPAAYCSSIRNRSLIIPVPTPMRAAVNPVTVSDAEIAPLMRSANVSHSGVSSDSFVGVAQSSIVVTGSSAVCGDGRHSRASQRSYADVGLVKRFCSPVPV